MPIRTSWNAVSNYDLRYRKQTNNSYSKVIQATEHIPEHIIIVELECM